MTTPPSEPGPPGNGGHPTGPPSYGTPRYGLPTQPAYWPPPGPPGNGMPTQPAYWPPPGPAGHGIPTQPAHWVPTGPPNYGPPVQSDLAQPGYGQPGWYLPAPPAPPRSDRWAAALLVALFAGCAVALALGVYGRVHAPVGYSINLAGFSGGLYAKAWLATSAALLGIVQVISSAIIYGKIGVGDAGNLAAPLHRWSGRVAVVLTVPVAVHCLFALGFETATPRTLVHSLLGCAFYGAFVTKMLVLSKRAVPGWVLPAVGAVVFMVLVGLWMTSSWWLFGHQGLHF